MTGTTEVSLVFDFWLSGLDLSKSQHLTLVRWEQEGMPQTCIVILCWLKLKTAKDEGQWLVGVVQCVTRPCLETAVSEERGFAGLMREEQGEKSFSHEMERAWLRCNRSYVLEAHVMVGRVIGYEKREGWGVQYEGRENEMGKKKRKSWSGTDPLKRDLSGRWKIFCVVCWYLWWHPSSKC